MFGVYFKLQSFFFMPLFGLNNATISIIAYNYGARKPQRITKTLKISCTAALCLMTVGLLVFQFFPDVLLGMFNPSQAFLEIGRVALRTISWSFPIAAICIALGASFQALGNGIYSTIVSLCRQLVVLLPVAYLLSLTRGGAEGLAGLPHSGGGQRHGDVYLLHQNLPPEDKAAV